MKQDKGMNCYLLQTNKFNVLVNLKMKEESNLKLFYLGQIMDLLC